jgi:hypothetical protein
MFHQIPNPNLFGMNGKMRYPAIKAILFDKFEQIKTFYLLLEHK